MIWLRREEVARGTARRISTLGRVTFDPGVPLNLATLSSYGMA